MFLSFRYNSFQIENNMHMFSIHSICFKYNRQNIYYIDDLVQDSSNSIASALELLESCTKPLIYLPPSHFRNLCLMFWHLLGLCFSVLIDHMGSCLFLWTSKSVSRQLCWEKWINIWVSLWCYNTDTFFTLLALYGETTSAFPYKGPVMHSFGVFFDVSLSKLLDT